VKGLQLLEDVKPELAFVDVQMPGFGGLELMQKASSLGMTTQFIVISGYAEFAYAQKAMFLGALSYCLKPFSKNEVLDCMEKAYRHICRENAENSALKLPDANRPAEEAAATSNRMVKTMLHYIDRNYSNDISIQDLADLCAVNSGYAGQLFRRETGETFSSYLTSCRIKKATELLEKTDGSVSEIACSVGYRDYFYFAKVFKRATGKTPSEFRLRRQ
jgi:two-component system response regulator YesN